MKKVIGIFYLLVLCFNSSFSQSDSQELYLQNESVSVKFDLMGGRVTEYSLSGSNVLYAHLEDSSMYTERELGFISPPGGRFDIGPEKIIPKRSELFIGKWNLLEKDDYEIIMISPKHEATGVQLTRIFTLDAKSSKLTCTQRIKNISKVEKRYAYWGRTFAKGNGISLTPLNSQSRYPEKFLMYGPDLGMMFTKLPIENLYVENDVLVITGPPKYPKFAMDSPEGWLAYLSTNDLLFIKKFPVYNDKIYGEMAANNVSIWYYKTAVCEIEPIGPWENILPGEETEFTEEWWLYHYRFPDNRKPKLRQINQFLIKSR